jgi:LuxR family maltose regulon positive regulatory protein
MDETDNDPSKLLANVAIAVSRVSVVDTTTLDALAARSIPVPNAISRLTPLLDSASSSVTLVLDNVEAVENPESLDVIGTLAWRLPLGSRLALASRSAPPIPAPVLRSRRNLLEIGVGDLAMDQQEAAQLLAECGMNLDAEAISHLVEQTEGWPVGLYLAALGTAKDSVGTGFAFGGNDVLIGDYLRAEVLARLPQATVTFLRRTSILEHLSASLCDAVLAAHGSQAALESLEASNLLLVPLDRQRHWYRYHRLFRDLLLTDLQRNDPDLVPELHRRAADWLEAHGMAESAIAHAQRAGDPDRVAALVVANTQPAYAAGRVSIARQWFEWFRTEHLAARYPQIAVLGAWTEALCGQPASVERWLAAAQAGPADGALPDGSRIEGWLAYLRIVLCRDGLEQMRADARTASEHLPPDSTLRASIRFFEGLSYLIGGDRDAADPILAQTVDLGLHTRAVPAAATALAERAVIAIHRRDWDAADALVARALSLVQAGHLEDYLGSGLVYAVAAQTAIHRGDSRVARDFAARAARLRPLFTYALPASAQIQLELARAYLGLSDPRGARSVLREMRDILRQRPNLGVLPQEADALWSMLDEARGGPAGASSLTAAELRLVPYLSTHLSFREIGERLYVSRHTVKTHALAVYRKLGVSSRSEAIDRLRATGLIAQ